VQTGDDVAAVRRRAASRLRRAVTEPIATRAGQQRVGVSIGLAVGGNRSDFTTLIAAADADMYRVKQQHRTAKAA
jgi:GGDEF domain-containing protein